MNDLIKIEVRGGIQTVNARDLWQRLNSKQEFANWIKSRLEDFIDGQDFLTILSKSTGGRPSTEYYLTIDTAKHCAMLEHNDKGREIRQYFIDFEKKTREVMAIPKTYAEALRLAADQAKALELAAPKVESFEALMRSDQTMSITDAAKHFGLHPKTEVFPYLRDRGYLTLADLPTQAAIDAGYLALRETKCPDGTVRKQAVVLASQLDAWRFRVVRQIKAWEYEA
jgi:anti-repressor protein